MRMTCSTRSAISVLRSRVEAAAVFVLGRRRPDHRAHARFAPLNSQQGAKQRLAVESIGLGPPPPARGRNRGRIDDVAFDAFLLQRAMKPETVRPCFLDGDADRRGRTRLSSTGRRSRWRQGKNIPRCPARVNSGLSRPGIRWRSTERTHRSETGRKTAAHPPCRRTNLPLEHEASSPR